MIQGIHHVSMKCSNAEEYAAVRAFYTELLRIPVLTEWETGILLDTGAGIVEIFQDETAEKLEQGVIRHERKFDALSRKNQTKQDAKSYIETGFCSPN